MSLTKDDLTRQLYIELRAAGWSDKKVEEEFNIKETALYLKKRDWGLNCFAWRREVWSLLNRNITLADIDALVEQYGSVVKAAKILGVNHQSLRRYAAKLGWQGRKQLRKRRKIPRRLLKQFDL